MQFNGTRKKVLPEVPIIPMIDTMFFLLVFFILTSLNVIQMPGMKINRPKARHSIPATRLADLTISIGPAPKLEIQINGKPLAPGATVGAQLISTLSQELHRAPTDQELSKESVIVNADGDATQAAVVGAINDAREVHLNKFSIATERGSQNQPVSVAPAAPAPG